MSREDELKMAPLRKADPSKWPLGVRSIAIDEADAIGVDAKGDLYWHGKPVEIKRPIVLSAWQSVLAAAAAVSAIILAVIEAARFARELGWF